VKLARCCTHPYFLMAWGFTTSTGITLTLSLPFLLRIRNVPVSIRGPKVGSHNCALRELSQFSQANDVITL
jgi:hypothetical protein